MSRRAHISDRTKLAALVCELLEIPHEHQVILHEDQVLSLIAWDHYPVPVALGGSDRFSNLRALLTATHKRITAKRDIPAIAKVKRLMRATAEAQARLLAKSTGEEPPPPPRRKAKINSRGFQKGHRPIRSRGFERRTT